MAQRPCWKKLQACSCGQWKVENLVPIFVAYTLESRLCRYWTLLFIVVNCWAENVKPSEKTNDWRALTTWGQMCVHIFLKDANSHFGKKYFMYSNWSSTLKPLGCSVSYVSLVSAESSYLPSEGWSFPFHFNHRLEQVIFRTRNFVVDSRISWVTCFGFFLGCIFSWIS